MKKLYVIPGFGESTRSKNYRHIIKKAKEFGFTIMPVNIQWKLHTPMSDFVRQAKEKISASTPEDYILGFSFGAYIVAVLALKKRLKGYIFCSISPYFKDDLKYITKETREYFGKAFMNSLKKYSFPRGTRDRAWFLIGDKDWEIAIRRAHKAYKAWGGRKKIYLVKGAGHELSNKNYVKQIKTILKKL